MHVRVGGKSSSASDIISDSAGGACGFFLDALGAAGCGLEGVAASGATTFMAIAAFSCNKRASRECAIKGCILLRYMCVSSVGGDVYMEHIRRGIVKAEKSAALTSRISSALGTINEFAMDTMEGNNSELFCCASHDMARSASAGGSDAMLFDEEGRMRLRPSNRLASILPRVRCTGGCSMQYSMHIQSKRYGMFAASRIRETACRPFLHCGPHDSLRNWSNAVIPMGHSIMRPLDGTWPHPDTACV
jgi:hypothetical protein